MTKEKMQNITKDMDTTSAIKAGKIIQTIESDKQNKQKKSIIETLDNILFSDIAENLSILLTILEIALIGCMFTFIKGIKIFFIAEIILASINIIFYFCRYVVDSKMTRIEEIKCQKIEKQKLYDRLEYIVDCLLDKTPVKIIQRNQEYSNEELKFLLPLSVEDNKIISYNNEIVYNPLTDQIV